MVWRAVRLPGMIRLFLCFHLFCVLLALGICDKQFAESVDEERSEAKLDNEGVPDWRARGRESLSFVISEFKALQQEIKESFIPHVERTSLVIAGTLCAITVLVIAVGVIVVNCRDKASDRMTYTALLHSFPHFIRQLQPDQTLLHKLVTSSKLTKSQSQTLLDMFNQYSLEKLKNSSVSVSMETNGYMPDDIAKKEH